MCEQSSFLTLTLRVIAWSLERPPSAFNRGLDPDVETFQRLPKSVISTVLDVPSPERLEIEKSGAKGSFQY